MVEIEPLAHMIDSQWSLPKYKMVKYGDYLRQSLTMKHDGKAHCIPQRANIASRLNFFTF